jgi:hypothetical protein
VISSLIRANANESGVYLSLIYDEEQKPIFIKKSASSAKSIRKLKNEIRGATWYQTNSDINQISKIIELPNYYSIFFHFFNGKKANFRDGYWLNRSYIEKALQGYCEIWSKLSQHENVIHGDYSIDNLIFTENELIIIDWEHFTNINLPKGFDALNLIYEQIYILSLKNMVCSNVILHANEMLERLKVRHCLDKIFFNSPLHTMQQYFLDNSYIWGKQLSKLPIMKFNKAECNILDNKINLLNNYKTL